MTALTDHTIDTALRNGYGRCPAVSVWMFPSRQHSRLVSSFIHPLTMKEVRCTECGHPKESHFDDKGKPYSNGCCIHTGPMLCCQRCGCQSAKAKDFKEVTLHSFRFYNEWILEAEGEEAARNEFADLSADFPVDVDVEELPEDHGQITCSDYEWARTETGDIQHEAEVELGRQLTKAELERVRDVFSDALQQGEAIQVAIEVALDNMK